MTGIGSAQGLRQEAAEDEVLEAEDEVVEEVRDQGGDNSGET